MKKILILLQNHYFIPLILALFSTAIFFKHSFIKHNSFNSNAFDLGIHAQISYLYYNNPFAFSSLKHMPLLADHFEPVMIIISPLYHLLPDAAILLFIQALFVGLSGIPIYLIAFDKLKKVGTSTIITTAYLASPGFISAINFDFHPSTLSVLPLSLILWGWYFKKWRFYWAMLAISLLFKEDIPLFLFGLGLYLLKENRRQGIATIIFSAVSFYLIKFIIMPLIWPGAEQGYLATSNLITDPITIFYLFLTRPTFFLDYIFNSPVKLNLIDTLYKQFVFLPLLSRLSWFMVFPYLFLRFTSNYTQMWSNEFHHNANLTPMLAVSAILAIYNFKIPYKVVNLLVIFILITTTFAPNGFILGTILSDPRTSANSILRSTTLLSIPATAKVSAQSPIVPHIANREKIYLFPEVLDAEYIVIDPGLSTYPLTSIELSNKTKEITSSGMWTLDKKAGGIEIFKLKN